MSSPFFPSLSSGCLGLHSLSGCSRAHSIASVWLTPESGKTLQLRFTSGEPPHTAWAVLGSSHATAHSESDLVPATCCLCLRWTRRALSPSRSLHPPPPTPRFLSLSFVRSFYHSASCVPASISDETFVASCLSCGIPLKKDLLPHVRLSHPCHRNLQAR